MSNHFFKFKQFTVLQHNTAMKVGTDGVLLGAWTDCNNANSILDIGTGTGLIALMLAQKSKANIVALEKEINAYNQAIENINNSEWCNRIEVKHISFQDYVLTENLKFDLIVSNPPFFTNSIKNVDSGKSLARHNDALPFEILIDGASKLMYSHSKFCVIIPYQLKDYVSQICATHGLFTSKSLIIKPNISKPPKRILLEFSFFVNNCFENILTIEKESRHEYTEDYISLTKDYYLTF